MGRFRFQFLKCSLWDSLFQLALVLQCFLGCLQLLDVLNVVYFPMVHRAILVMQFEMGFSLVQPLLLLLVLWLLWMVWMRHFEVLLYPALAVFVYPFLGWEASLSVASLLAVLVCLWLRRDFYGFFSWVFVVFGFLEAAALFHWVVFLPFGLTSPFEGFAWVEMGLFYLFAYLVPLLVLPLLYMWVFKPLLRWALRKGANFEDIGFKKERKPSSKSVALFFFSISLGLVAALYPYFPAINPNGFDVGVDIPTYVRVGEIVERDPSQAFNVMNGSRPTIFLVIYGFQRLLSLDVSTTVRFLPIILNPLMIVAIFFMAFEAFNDWRLSSWAAFFTVCSYQVTVGMYAYYLTNMFALSLTFLSLGFLFRSLRRSCNMSQVLASILGVLLVFTHPWTFNQYGTTTILTMIVSFYRTRKEKRNYNYINRTLLYIFFLGIVDLIKTLSFHGTGAFSASSTVLTGISNLSEFWFDSIFSFRLRFGGIFSVFVLFCLAVIGVYLNGLCEFSEIYFTILPAITSLPFLIGDEAIKSRLLYNIPVGLFAAIGFSNFLRWKAKGNLMYYLTSFIVLNLTVYMFRSLANLV